MQFGENGWGVKKHKDEMANLITAEAFELSSVALEGLLNDTCYNNPEIYCQLVESVAEKREDEARFLTQDMKDKLAALRPQILMGLNCREHSLKEYMIYEMGFVPQAGPHRRLHPHVHVRGGRDGHPARGEARAPACGASSKGCPRWTRARTRRTTRS